jgi:hypothetical protein
MRRVFVLLACIAGLCAPGRATALPLAELSLSGPSYYDADVPFDVLGALTVAGAGLPLQSVDIDVDGQSVRTVQTALDGTYVAQLLFDASAPAHEVRAIAYGETPLEASASLTVTRRAVVTIDVAPAEARVEIGAQQQFTATGTYNDGSVRDVTAEAMWTSSDTRIASVDAGLAGGQEPGTASITAELDGVLSNAAALEVIARPVGGGLVINEVDYDQPGTDTEEFIEVYNGGSAVVDLAGAAIVLVNGATGLEYARITLSGVLAPGEYAVAASSTVNVAAGAVRFSLHVDSNAIQNGAPDGVALVDLGTATLLDALSYEGSLTMAQIDGLGTFDLVEGNPTTASDDPNVAGSLVRLPNGIDTDDASVDWVFSVTPSPGSANT